LARYQKRDFQRLLTRFTIALHCKCCGISVICLRIDSMNFYMRKQMYTTSFSSSRLQFHPRIWLSTCLSLFKCNNGCICLNVPQRQARWKAGSFPSISQTDEFNSRWIRCCIFDTLDHITQRLNRSENLTQFSTSVQTRKVISKPITVFI